MTTRDGIRWFKENFQEKVENAVEGTPSDSRLHRGDSPARRPVISGRLCARRNFRSQRFSSYASATRSIPTPSRPARPRCLRYAQKLLSAATTSEGGTSPIVAIAFLKVASVSRTWTWAPNVSTSAPTAAPIRVELKTRLRSAAWSSRNLQHNSRLVAPDCAVGPLAASKIV
jgi:hypothetical protein